MSATAYSRRRISYCAVFFVLAVLLYITVPFTAQADTAAELQKQIDDHAAQIQALDKEIASYTTQLTQVGAQKQTLQTTLKQLDLSRQKIAADISRTENTIAKTQLEIVKLAGNISDKETAIQTGTAGIASSLRSADRVESETMLESFLAHKSIAETWNDLETTQQIRSALGDQLVMLSLAKSSLVSTKTATEAKKKDLVTYQGQLKGQKVALDVNRQEKADLLAQTKSQEANYQKILAAKKTAKAQFEKSLTDLEAKLKFTLNPATIPAAGSGVLHWPLDKVRITQAFGKTDFAKAGAYNGQGHNGVDFAAPVGTPIKAALDATVVGTGNTDAYSGCYSYGKWVLLRHENGLSTLYAHFSQIAVSAGQKVITGEVIGYSGATGYATGPHLHFTVYAAGAVQVARLGDFRGSNKTPCSAATIPVSALSGYLNPMDYL
jgi:murein DD-endopeptidase MepM/ murein hydrolase activator NlpD